MKSRPANNRPNPAKRDPAESPPPAEEKAYATPSATGASVSDAGTGASVAGAGTGAADSWGAAGAAAGFRRSAQYFFIRSEVAARCSLLNGRRGLRSRFPGVSDGLLGALEATRRETDGPPSASSIASIAC